MVPVAVSARLGLEALRTLLGNLGGYMFNRISLSSLSFSLLLCFFRAQGLECEGLRFRFGFGRCVNCWRSGIGFPRGRLLNTSCVMLNNSPFFV